VSYNPLQNPNVRKAVIAKTTVEVIKKMKESDDLRHKETTIEARKTVSSNSNKPNRRTTNEPSMNSFDTSNQHLKKEPFSKVTLGEKSDRYVITMLVLLCLSAFLFVFVSNDLGFIGKWFFRLVSLYTVFQATLYMQELLRRRRMQK
jgi:hypothetical protein